MRLAALMAMLALCLVYGAQFAIDRVGKVSDQAEARQNRAAPARPPQARDLAAPAAAPEGPSLFRRAVRPTAGDDNAPFSEIELAGLFSDGERTTVLLRDHNSGRIQSASAGDSIGPWRIVSVTSDCVVLQRKRDNRRVCKG